MIGYKDVSLHPVEKEHVSFLVKCGNSKGLWKQRLDKKRTCLSEQTEFVETSGESPDHFLFVVEREKTTIGVCEIKVADRISRSCRLHLYFEDRAETVPHSGESTLNAILMYVFDTLGMHRVSVDVVIDDVVMVSLYKKFGFRQEVRKRQHYYSDGSYKTVIEMGFLEDEFEVVS